MKITELISQFMQLEEDKEALGVDETHKQGLEYEETKDALTLMLKDKIDSIDKVVIDMTKREFLIDAEVEALGQEILRLKTRKRALIRFKEFVNKFIIPWAIEKLGKGGTWETSYARYTLYETWGPLQVMAKLEDIPEKFRKVEISESVDKKLARQECLKGKGELPWCYLPRVKRIRRS